MRDGLYQVQYKSICAGFVVTGGKIVRCAPVLRRKLQWWITKAVRIAP